MKRWFDSIYDDIQDSIIALADMNARIAFIFGCWYDSTLTYKDYSYDSDTGMYYLQSRYYDPEVGRFINADDTEILNLTQGTVNGANLFAYCNNDPVQNEDPSGEIAANIISGLVTAFVSTLIDVGVKALVYYLKHGKRMTGFKVKWKEVLFNAALCFASGFLLATRYKTIVQVVGNSLIAGVQSIVTSKSLKASARIVNLIIDVSFAVIFSIASGNGVGAKFWNGGFSAYYVKIFKTIQTLRPQKPVLKAFAKAFGYYIAASLTASFKNAMAYYNRI